MNDDEHPGREEPGREQITAAPSPMDPQIRKEESRKSYAYGE